MERLLVIDNLRGIAFLFMVFQHLFYFYDVSTDNKTSYSTNDIIFNSGLIARILFIFLSGYSVYMTYKKDSKIHLNKRIKRSMEILTFGLILTGISYLLYPNNYIRFGILHFIALSTLLVSIISPYKVLSIVAFIVSIGIRYPNINSFIDTITGASAPAPMMDWFPLDKWMPIILLGLIAGQNFDIAKANIPLLEFNNIITDIGKNSLNLYIIHIIILLVFYKGINLISQ